MDVSLSEELLEIVLEKSSFEYMKVNYRKNTSNIHRNMNVNSTNMWCLIIAKIVWDFLKTHRWILIRSTLS